MINIFDYHWVWYFLGFLCCPKLTFVIFLSIYFPNCLPLPLFIVVWFYAIIGSFEVIKEGNTIHYNLK